MSETTSTKNRMCQSRFKQGLLFGLMAGLAATLFTVVTRFAWSSLTITELAADWFTTVIPAPLFDYLLETLSFSAKPLMFIGLLVAQVLVGGGIGALYGRITDMSPASPLREWWRASGFSFLLWLLSMMALVPALGGGFFASAVPGGPFRFVLASLASYAVYGLSLGYLFAEASQARTRGPDRLARRAFLRKVGKWGIIAAIIGYGLKFIFQQTGTQFASSGAFRIQGVLSTEVTPNDEFYVVSKNVVDPDLDGLDLDNTDPEDPEIDSARWSLEITGLVEEPFTLTYAELKAMPSVEEFVTLICISNPVGGGLISNARWRGVPLKLLLDKARLKPGVADVAFRAWDDYSESVSLTKAMSDELLVVYEMNGEPLPPEHGFPVRLIIPGFYGLKSVKWLTTIEPVDHDFRGYWQQRGWDDVPIVKTMSRFDTPLDVSEHPVEAVELGGVAFAGNRAISNVEVSTDEGRTWTPVSQISKPLSPYTWVIWRIEFEPSREGELRFSVRGTNGQGEVQTAERARSLPDGATGHHQMRLFFSDPS